MSGFLYQTWLLMLAIISLMKFIITILHQASSTYYIIICSKSVFFFHIQMQERKQGQIYMQPCKTLATEAMQNPSNNCCRPSRRMESSSSIWHLVVPILSYFRKYQLKLLYLFKISTSCLFCLQSSPNFFQCFTNR